MVLKGNRGRYLEKLIYGVAERYEFKIVELAVMPDHVHMSVLAPPNLAPAEIIQKVKSITATKLFDDSPASSGFCGEALCGAEAAF